MACLELCKSNPSCQWFTFSTKSRNCELSTVNCSVLDSNICSGCLSGTYDCIPKDPLCFIQGECQGTTDHFELTESSEECLLRCKSTLGCRGFTFQESSSSCCLFKDEMCSNCIIGETKCEPDQSIPTEQITTSRPKGKMSKINLYNLLA